MLLLQMDAIGFSLWGEQRGSLAVGDKVKRTVFDIGEPFLVEDNRPLAGMVQCLKRDGITFGQP